MVAIHGGRFSQVLLWYATVILPLQNQSPLSVAKFQDDVASHGSLGNSKTALVYNSLKLSHNTCISRAELIIMKDNQ